MAKKAAKKEAPAAKKKAAAPKAAKPAKKAPAKKAEAKPAKQAKAPAKAIEKEVKAKATKAPPPAPKIPEKKEAAKPAPEPKAEKKAKATPAPVVAVEEAPKKKEKKVKLDKTGLSEDQVKWHELHEKYQTLKAPTYSISGQFEARTPIQHKIFGWGFILSNEYDRLEVLFEDGKRMLISNRQL